MYLLNLGPVELDGVKDGYALVDVKSISEQTEGKVNNE
jgi:hypothetical protein